MCSSKVDRLSKVLLKCCFVTTTQVWSSAEDTYGWIQWHPGFPYKLCHCQSGHSLDSALLNNAEVGWGEDQSVCFIYSISQYLPVTYSQSTTGSEATEQSKSRASLLGVSYSGKKSRPKTDINETMWKMLNLGTEKNTVNPAVEFQKSFHTGDNTWPSLYQGVWGQEWVEGTYGAVRTF